MPALISQEKVKRGADRRERAEYIAPTRGTGELAARLARRLGKTCKGGQGDIDRVRATVRHLAAIVAGDRTMAREALDLIAPLQIVASVNTVPAFDPALLLAAQEADIAEDLAEARWHADPSRANLLELRAKKSKVIQCERLVLAAIGEALA